MGSGTPLNSSRLREALETLGDRDEEHELVTEARSWCQERGTKSSSVNEVFTFLLFGGEDDWI